MSVFKAGEAALNRLLAARHSLPGKHVLLILSPADPYIIIIIHTDSKGKSKSIHQPTKMTSLRCL